VADDASLRALAIGGAHIDRRGQVSVPYVPGASNPGTLREEVGGGALNALRAAVRLGASGTLISVRGGDAAGVAVETAVADAGIADRSVTFLDRTTPSYTALIDRDGELIAALADMSLYEMAFAKQMRRASVRAEISRADLVIADANLPREALMRLAGLAGRPRLFAIAISPAKVVRLRGLGSAIDCLFLNRREARALCDTTADDPLELCAALRAAGFRSAVLTAGADVTAAYDEATLLTATPPPASRIVDVTGAGDALAGALALALAGGLPLAEALRRGLAASRLAVESQGCAPDLRAEAFAAALAQPIDIAMHEPPTFPSDETRDQHG
jgi:pseudouridine kinase